MSQSADEIGLTPQRPLDAGDRDGWRRWLEDNHARSTGVWLLLVKKNSPRPGLRMDEALDEALCFGWIDSRLRSLDEHTFVLRYSPRRPDSVWSLRNRRHVERLLHEGRLTPAGLALVEEARRRGTWDAAYTNREPRPQPAALEAALARDPGAQAFFSRLPVSRRNACAAWVEGAKTESTRTRRIDQIVSRCRDGLPPGA